MDRIIVVEIRRMDMIPVRFNVKNRQFDVMCLSSGRRALDLDGPLKV